jgi:hypothetical protein
MKTDSRQRSGKHSRTQQQKNGVFYVVRAAATFAMQRRSKYASTTIQAVFSAGSMPRSYLEDN